MEITTEDVFKSAMRPRQISERPAVPPIAIHWPKMLLNQLEDRVEIAFSDQPALLTEGDIELLDHNRTGPLRFSVSDDVHTAELEVVLATRELAILRPRLADDHKDRPNHMLQHMLKREKLRRDKGVASWFKLGTAAALKKLEAGWRDYRYEYDIKIVQPGLSRGAVGEEGLHSLAGAEAYWLETRAMPLRIIASP